MVINLHHNNRCYNGGRREKKDQNAPLAFSQLIGRDSRYYGIYGEFTPERSTSGIYDL